MAAATGAAVRRVKLGSLTLRRKQLTGMEDGVKTSQSNLPTEGILLPAAVRFLVFRLPLTTDYVCHVRTGQAFGHHSDGWTLLTMCISSSNCL